MASLTTNKSGQRRLLFMLPGKGRREIWLGGMEQGEALRFHENFESLLSCRRYGRAEGPVVVQWLAGLPDRFHERLVAFGLAEPRAEKTPGQTTLGGFVNGYIAGRVDVKHSTWSVMDQTRKNLIGFFGSHKPLREITDGHADDFRLWLVGTKLLGENTIRRRCGVARQFFRAAIRKKLLQTNPFAELKVTVRGNPKRSYFITREEAQAVIDACPNAEWRLLFALARWGALRTPSETLALTWGDVNWAAGRFTVHSPKTEAYPGKETRLVPIFPELEPHFLAMWNDQAPDEPIITRYRNPVMNLRTGLNRIIRKAGLVPWPKLWQNCRATRETELSERWPLKTVCAWVGNSRPVAMEHYLTVPEEHFEQAAAGTTHFSTQSGPVSAGQHNTGPSETGSVSNVLTDANRPKQNLTEAKGYAGRDSNSGQKPLQNGGVREKPTQNPTQTTQLDALKAWLAGCPVQLTAAQQATIRRIIRGR